MSDFKFWDWDKKPRTMLRFIKPGDIFCFFLAKDKYLFGRIISRFDIGDVAEIFEFISAQPFITELDVKNSQQIIEPIVLNTFSLFDRKSEVGSDWRIIGHQENYSPMGCENIYFTYGLDKSCKKIDIFNNEISISEEEAKKIPRLSPHNDYDIKQLLKNI